MDTRKTLEKRPDVKDADIDDLIGIAARLQDEERALHDAAASRADVEAVAAELDIDPQYIDRAIETLREERAAEAVATEQAQRDADKASEAQRAMLGMAGAGVGGLGLLILLVLGVMGWSASARLHAAQANVSSAQVNLDTVLQRQASLAPQLIAMAGGNAAQLQSATATMAAASTTEERLKASTAVSTAMATALGRLPPAGPGDGQARADLRHEVSGFSNRITVEQRRWEEAKVRYEAEQSGLGATVAMGLGLH